MRGMSARRVYCDDEKYHGEWGRTQLLLGPYTFAEVTVDLTTYSVTVGAFVAVQEIGKVLHPFCCGQLRVVWLRQSASRSHEKGGLA